MGNREYLLRGASESICKEELKRLEDLFQSSSSQNIKEAIFVGRFIYLPDNKIKEPANLMVKSLERKRIDHTRHFKSKELQNKMRDLQESLKLSQQETKKIVNIFLKLEKNISNNNQIIDELLEMMDECAEKIVIERQIKEYVNRLIKSCDNLSNSLFIENPKVLPDKIKEEILNKISVLQCNIDMLKEQLSN